MRLDAQIYVHGHGVLVCSVDADLSLQIGCEVVLRSNNMLLSGKIEALSAVAPDAQQPDGIILRCMTDKDEKQQAANRYEANKLLRTLRTRVFNAGLWLKPVAAYMSFGRDCLIFLIGSNDDFDRQKLVELLPEVKIRIEFHRIGPRDEASIIGGIGPCGRALCCCSWQKEYGSINVRMAKAQDMSLNPAAINGICNKLKCCLKFEYTQYCEAEAHLPAVGSMVFAEKFEGKGKVIGRDILKGIIVIRSGEGKIFKLPVSELRSHDVNIEKTTAAPSENSIEDDNENFDN
jgi:cell fate regulator YaaT (PSP1 superfamily)